AGALRRLLRRAAVRPARGRSAHARATRSVRRAEPAVHGASAVSSTEKKRRKQPADRAATSRGKRKWLIVGSVSLPLLGLALWMMLQPSTKAAFAISARTGSLVLEPLCGERLIWDFGAGR